MRLIIGILAFILFSVSIAVATTWATLALWYRLPAPELVRAVASCVAALAGLATIVALLTRMRIRAVVLFLVAFAGVLGWWSTIKPPASADWAPDVARQVTGSLEGDTLTLTDVRDFEWRSKTDFTERWTTRTYDLNGLRSLDLFMSYWSGPDIAHVIMSFGFEGGEYLAWSVEVRRRVGGQFSPIADFFKSNALVIVAADERDVVGVRSNVRGEDVQIYRLKASPAAARALLLAYVEDANALAAAPQFYNSVTTNCTTVVVRMMRAIGDRVPLDWRLIVNGYLPEYAYDRGALDMRYSLEELRSLAHIDKRAQAAGLAPDFSRLIRVGAPDPSTVALQ
ncbi:DUF4105 domain-containing protein [Sinorhizobium sp. BG8]|uniref:lipoprotein N-acyltransferase Lnb domain-containing protein n=1 Tax=Sinorhizobium sp. BG8 TaxID=2613773 RepID=UPI001FEF67AE|nr:DUF4105 domain-containing protein [Sinorhizobium sp. BG8]